MFFLLGSVLSSLLFLLVPVAVALFLVVSVVRLKFGRRGGGTPPPPPDGMIEGEFVDGPEDEDSGDENK